MPLDGILLGHAVCLQRSINPTPPRASRGASGIGKRTAAFAALICRERGSEQRRLPTLASCWARIRLRAGSA